MKNKNQRKRIYDENEAGRMMMEALLKGAKAEINERILCKHIEGMAQNMLDIRNALKGNRTRGAAKVKRLAEMSLAQYEWLRIKYKNGSL